MTDRVVDLARGEADVAIRCGPGVWPGVKATRLMGEEVFPVCSPGLIGEARPTAEWLGRQALIHDLLAPPGLFPTWDRWLEHAGWAAQRGTAGLGINASAAVIEAWVSANWGAPSAINRI